MGVNKEDIVKKGIEFEEAIDEIPVFTQIGGYAYKECCYSLAGVIADKVRINLDHIPYSNSDVDMISLYSFLRQYLDTDIIDAVVEKAIPATEKLVIDNINMITKVADALVSAPNRQLDNAALNALLSD